MHDFYVNGGGFVWRWPTFDRGLNPADKRTRIGLNRYPHNVIGAYVVVFRRGFGVRWKASPKRSMPSPRGVRSRGGFQCR